MKFPTMTRNAVASTAFLINILSTSGLTSCKYKALDNKHGSLLPQK